MTAALDDATLYGLTASQEWSAPSIVDLYAGRPEDHSGCEAAGELYGGSFCLATHKPGVCAGTRRGAGTPKPAQPQVHQRLHVAVPDAPAAKTPQQQATEASAAELYQRALQAAQHLAGQLGGALGHQRVQSAVQDYARASHAHGRAVARADAAQARAQDRHDSAQARNRAIDEANRATQAAALARAAATARRRALAAAARRHPHASAQHSAYLDEVELYALVHQDPLGLYAQAALAHWSCNVGEFCRNPLHPGPCKGWKHTLHAVAPGAYHAYEKARVAKLNERRRAKIAALQVQGKPVPKRLLKEITYVPPGAGQAQPGFTPPTAQGAKDVVSNIAGKAKTNVPARAAQLTDQKLTDQAQAFHDVVVAVQGRTGASPAALKTALTAAKAQQKPGDKLTDHPHVQSSIAKLVKNVGDRANLSDKERDALHAEIADHIQTGTHGVPKGIKDALAKVPPPAPARPAAAPTPSAPLPATAPAHVKHAASVASRSAPGAGLSKNHLDAYGKVTRAEFDQLPKATQDTIRADLSAAHGKFLDPKRKAAAQALLDRFAPGQAPAAPQATPSAPGPLSTHVQDALDAAGRVGKMPRGDAVKALTGLTKSDFDALGGDDQRKILDALHHYHVDQKDRSGSMFVRDQQVEKAFTDYTGQHPALHRLKQAEADFRAGKIGSDKVYSAYVHARVQAPTTFGKTDTPGAHLTKEAQRVAEDNPALAPWLRSRLVEIPYTSSGGGAARAAAMTQLQSNWEPAPRLSAQDVTELFSATDAGLKDLHPIHQQAVRDLREHAIVTGLAANSPWSDSTKNHLVDNVLHVSSTNPQVPSERLKQFDALPDYARTAIKKQLNDRVQQASNDHDKTRHLYTLAQVNHTPLSPVQHEVIKAAANHYPYAKNVDTYRKLEPSDFSGLAGPIQGAILTHLHEVHKRDAAGGAVRNFSAADDPLTAMPDALAAHLAGTRLTYRDLNTQLASDVANYGRDLINPETRADRYAYMGSLGFSNLDVGDKRQVDDDLDRIANGPHPIQLRYAAQHTKDFALTSNGPPHLNHPQQLAADRADPDPNTGYDDSSVITALHGLSKTDFDGLDKAYRDAIDERIKTLGSGSIQQALTAKFHPGATPATPAGYVPTVSTPAAPVPPHVQAALDAIYGVHPRAHTMAHQLNVYGALRGSDFAQLNAQEQGHLLGDLSFISTTAKGPNADKARKLIDRFTPPGTPSGQAPTPAIVAPANAVPGQVRYATPMQGTLAMAKDKGLPGDGWTRTSTGQQVWGKYGAAGLLLMHQDPASGERRYLMVQRGPAISDPGKWQFPGGAIDEKETFHQGGAREVIEELGFDKDALKTAQVHGEHTHSIPGSSWKYVSIAAQVPSMLKPDLSTHHARAETSDAKWMTEDEIRKLDTSGKLLAPLAGGKLHQNVISLFAAGTAPSGAPAAPGPVTRRQTRLRVPSTGRLAPAQFNAWAPAHKPSRGKNLLTDKTAIDKLRQDVKRERVKYDGKTADGRLAAIGAMQGFDDTPTVLSKAEVDRLLATGDYIEAWRGVKGTGRFSGGRAKTAADINEEFRSGPAYYGKGVFGNGYYLAAKRSIADQYSDGTKNSLLRILIPKSAVIDTHQKMAKEAEKIASPRSKSKGNTFESGTLYDVGRYAAAKGVDGVRIDPVGYQGARGMSSHHVSSKGQEAHNWLNRSVLIVQEAE